MSRLWVTLHLLFLSAEDLWVLLHLLFLSAEDLWEGQVLLLAVLELGLTGFVQALWEGRSPALVPGFVLLLFSRITGEKIGYGDCYLVLALGMWMTSDEIWRMLFLGTLLACGTALCSGKKELPFVPFLTAAYVLGECL